MIKGDRLRNVWGVTYRYRVGFLQFRSVDGPGEDRRQVVNVADRNANGGVGRTRGIPTIGRDHQYAQRVRARIVVEGTLQDQLGPLGTLETKREVAAFDLLRGDRVLDVGIRRVWLITINCLNSIKHHRLNWR